MRKIYLLILISAFACQFANGQKKDEKLLKVNFQRITLEAFVSELETTTGLHFYYAPKIPDTIRITVRADSATVPHILDLAFQNTPLNYVITEENQVVITFGFKLNEQSPSNAGGSEPLTPDKTAATNGSFFSGNDKKTAQAVIQDKLYEIGIKTNTIRGGNATLAGYVFNATTGAPVVGATIYVAENNKGVATDKFGFYSVTLAKGKYTLLVRSIGTKDAKLHIVLYGDGQLSIDVQDEVMKLKEVKISDKKLANVKGLEMGVNRLDIKTIKEIPAVFGEADVLRAVLVLPGVQTVGEATTGFNVRGGSADQNLILLNDAVVYNPAHFFGFFSAFNPDIIKDVQLYKNTVPERFGGRLSSVLDVNDREGNKKNFSGTAGIGLLTSRLSVEGPIVNDKTSFLFGARTTYSNWLLQLLPESYKHSKASFYDVNLDLSHQINAKNNLYLYGYLSNDSFKLNGDTAYGYSNKNISLKWKHVFNNKLYGVATGGFNRYQYNISSYDNPVNAYRLDFNINQTNFKADFNYYASTNHTIDFGISSVYYALNPGNYQPNGDGSLVAPNIVPRQQALESALYVGDRFDVTDNLSLEMGIRYSLYNFLGPKTVYDYAPNIPKTTNTVVGTVTYGQNKVIKTYAAPEIRISARYTLSTDMSVKAAYNTMHQYLHLLTNTTAISPTDVYQLSDPNIKPQFGDQVSLGLYKNLQSNIIETSVEVYYKRIRNYLDYKSGAVLVLNPHIETDVINTEGKAYGIEFLLRKSTGKLNGLMSYTYSRTFLKQDDSNAGELINDGAYYPANYDKPNNVNLTGNYRVSHRFSLSLNVTYSTGRPITLPITKYSFAGSARVYYSDRNAYRVPDYFRSDFSVNVEGNHKVNQRLKSSFTFGVYNLTGRQNAYSTYFSSQGGAISGYQLSIFAAPIPFVNYNIKF